MFALLLVIKNSYCFIVFLKKNLLCLNIDVNISNENKSSLE